MRKIKFSRIFTLVLATIGLAWLSFGSSKEEPQKHIVFLVGDDLNHASGTHEFYAGGMLLKKSLENSTLSEKVTCSVINNWPENTDVLESADVIVHYYKGNKAHFMNDHHDLIDSLAKKGMGQLFIHYAVDPEARAEPFIQKWTGAVYKTGFSSNPIWNLKAKLENHPINSGVKELEIRDEWYVKMDYQQPCALNYQATPETGKVHAIMSGTPDAAKGNRKLTRALAKNKKPSDLTIFWAKENGTEYKASRGAGLTGAHFHQNWANDSFRKQVLNAIAWCAHLPIPENGISSPQITEDMLNENLDKRKPKFGRLKLAQTNAPASKPLTGQTPPTPEQKPNIVFIMADDLGPGWVDYDDSNPKVVTPNLQRMAETGMVFSRAYAACSVCSPTRAACMTGMSPAQIGMTTHIPGKAGNERKGPKGGPKDADSLKHLPLALPSYARELKKQGYATGFIGKWHLAGEGSIATKNGIVNKAWHPENYGFDSNIGGCAYGQPRPWFDPYRNGTIENRKKGEYLTDRLGDEAASFIEENKDKPFHLTFWPYSVHTPIKAPKALVKKHGGNNYLAMLESLDTAVGKVITALEKTGNLNNTMLIFYSDNGGHIRTEWLADKKASLLEGGLRVPMVVSWPDVIKGGTKCDAPITSMDFFPTFVHAAGGTTSEIKQLEGLDLKPLFQGADKLDRDALYWHMPHNRMEVTHYMGGTVLEGAWKFYKGYGLIPDKLFNLKDDSMEKINTIKDHPERAKRLEEKLNAWLTKVSAKMPKAKK